MVKLHYYVASLVEIEMFPTTQMSLCDVLSLVLVIRDTS